MERDEMLPAEFDVFPLLFTLPHRARAMRQSVKSFLTKVFWLGIPSIRAWHSIGSTQQIQAQTHTHIFIYRGRGSLFDERQHQIERCSQPSKGKQDWPRRLNPGQVVQRRYPPPFSWCGIVDITNAPSFFPVKSRHHGPAAAAGRHWRRRAIKITTLGVLMQLDDAQHTPSAVALETDAAAPSLCVALNSTGRQGDGKCLCSGEGHQRLLHWQLNRRTFDGSNGTGTDIIKMRRI